MSTGVRGGKLRCGSVDENVPIPEPCCQSRNNAKDCDYQNRFVGTATYQDKWYQAYDDQAGSGIGQQQGDAVDNHPPCRIVEQDFYDKGDCDELGERRWLNHQKAVALEQRGSVFQWLQRVKAFQQDACRQCSSKREQPSARYDELEQKLQDAEHRADSHELSVSSFHLFKVQPA